jgi:hypothetical protein
MRESVTHMATKATNDAKMKILKRIAYFVVLILTILLALPAYASVAVDNTSSDSGIDSSMTISHTTGSGADRLMLVGISGFGTISSVTYGGVSLTLVGEKRGGWFGMARYKLLYSLA